MGILLFFRARNRFLFSVFTPRKTCASIQSYLISSKFKPICARLLLHQIDSDFKINNLRSCVFAKRACALYKCYVFGEIMSLVEILLTLICVFLIFVILQLSSLVNAFKTTGTILAQELGRDFEKSQTQRVDMIEELNRIQENTYECQQMHSDISEIKYVMDLIYKYKLPSKSEREYLDELEITNEVLDGISN